MQFSIWQLVLITESYLNFAFAGVCFLLAVTALVKCLPKNAQRFEMSFKRTKNFWMLMTGGAAVLGLITLLPMLMNLAAVGVPVGSGPFGLIFPVVAACMALVYLTDVEPEVS